MSYGKSRPPKNPLSDAVPDFLLRQMAWAIERGKLGMVLVVSTEAMDTLKGDRPFGIQLEDGGMVILVTQAAVEKAYGDDHR